MLSGDDETQKNIFRRSLWSVSSENASSEPFQDIDVAKQKILELLQKRYGLWKEWAENMNTILELERHAMDASFRKGLYCEGLGHMDKEGAEVIHDLRKNVHQIRKKIKKLSSPSDSILNLEEELLAVINEDDFISWVLENLETQLSSSMEILANALKSHEDDRRRISELTEYTRLGEKALQRISSSPKFPRRKSKGILSSSSRLKQKSSIMVPYKSNSKFASVVFNESDMLRSKDEYNEVRSKMKRRKVQERILQEKVHELLGQITAIDTDAALISGLVTKLVPQRRRTQDHKWLGKIIPLTVTAHETSIRLEQFHENVDEVKEKLRQVEEELVQALSSWDVKQDERKQEGDELLALPPPKKEKETDLLKYFRSVWAILRPKIKTLSDHATSLNEEVKASVWTLIEYTKKEIYLEKIIERLEIKLVEKDRRTVPTMKQRLKENLIRFKFLKEDTALENQYISNIEDDIKSFRAETLIMESLRFRIDQYADDEYVKSFMTTSVNQSYQFCYFWDPKSGRRADSKIKLREHKQSIVHED